MTNKYLLSLSLGTTYTLSGADADADFSPASDQVLTAYLTSGAFGCAVALSGLGRIKITGARLTNANCEVEGNGPVAAKLKLRLSKIVEGSESGDPFASFDMNIAKWNRWEKKNIVIDPNPGSDTGVNRACQLVLDDASTFYVFDYNVQDDMKGPYVQPILELEIEADSILDASTGLAV